MLLQNSEVLADAKRTAAEGYAPLKRALARFQQLSREEGRDTAPAPESSRWLLAGQTKTQEPAAAQPAPQPQPQPQPQPEPEPGRRRPTAPPKESEARAAASYRP